MAAGAALLLLAASGAAAAPRPTGQRRAIIVGKANLSEWANVRSAPSSSGGSGFAGQMNLATE